MNREDILRMARESGGLPDPMVFIRSYERFAALIEQHCNTDRPPPHKALLEKAQQEEREACAKVCREIMDDHWTGDDRWETARHCSEMILERGKK